jgi:hypothetical protein
MDLDTVMNDLAHDLWTLAQGHASIEDVVTPMMAELLSFADAVRAAERAPKALRRLDLCKCDHNEYCHHCFPVEFRAG